MYTYIQINKYSFCGCKLPIIGDCGIWFLTGKIKALIFCKTEVRY